MYIYNMAIIQYDLYAREYENSNRSCLERPNRSEALVEITFVFF